MELNVSRQPIFGRDEKVAGYEVLYSGRPEQSGALLAATPDQVVDTLLGIGLDRLTDGKPAFITASRELVESGSLDLLNRDAVVITIPHAGPGEVEYFRACERLAASGFRLAMDTSALEGDGAFLPLLTILRVDLEAYAGPLLDGLAERIRPHSVRLLAEKIRSATLRDACLEAGFELFHGHGFGRDDIMGGRDLPIAHLRTATLMQKVRDINVTDSQIEESFRTDLSLSYKLLRMVNSAAVGSRGVESIGHAIRLLGRETLYRWLALLFLASTADTGVRAQVVQTSLMRGRLCELLAGPAGHPAEAGSLYITGLLSLLDVLLAVPMAEIVSQMGVTAEVRQALLHREGLHGSILRLVEAYDLGEWSEFAAYSGDLGIGSLEVGAQYLEALKWASDLASGLTPG
jgi:EAL and modified HD-GYP domain-containing signal transduction protein